jgi:ABC-type transporter Mla MlaB component
MSVAIRAYREGNHARLVATGPFDLAHATMAARAVENLEAQLAGCGSVDVDLAQLERIDGAGAVLLARLLDRLDAGGRHARVIEGPNREAGRLIVPAIPAVPALRREIAYASAAASPSPPPGRADRPVCDSPPTSLSRSLSLAAASGATVDSRSVVALQLTRAVGYAVLHRFVSFFGTANFLGSSQSDHKRVARSAVLLRELPARPLVRPAGLPLF